MREAGVQSQDLTTTFGLAVQLLPYQAPGITGIELGKSTCGTTSGLTHCCGIYCACSCVAEGDRNGHQHCFDAPLGTGGNLLTFTHTDSFNFHTMTL